MNGQAWEPGPGEVLFRRLTPQEVGQFIDYAQLNEPDLDKWEVYHPVCREEWTRLGKGPTNGNGHDPTELARRELLVEINSFDPSRTSIEPSWDTEALQRDFEVLSFLAPFVYVRRRADGVKGTLLFRHSPRVYFQFEPE